MQQGLSIGTGVFMLAFIWMPRLAQLISGGGIVCRLQGKVTTAMAGLLRQHRAPALLGLGFLNGLLPCGLVYLALAGALVSYHPAQGALFMAAFGLGTVPALLGVALSGNVVGITWRSSLRKLAPLLATAIAILFIIRGLGLGIPYLSPELGPAITATHACDTLD
jgi:sulfite exporter TauE/SafE